MLYSFHAIRRQQVMYAGETFMQRLFSADVGM